MRIANLYYAQLDYRKYLCYNIDIYLLYAIKFIFGAGDIFLKVERLSKNTCNIDEIKNELKQMLDEIRYAHTVAVCETAVILAERFGADKEKACLTALLHDCARGLDEKQQRAYCRENGIELDEYMQNDVNPVHAIIGADMAKRRFGINDKEILNAIYKHAVGCEDMSLLDKIILVADAIEPNRDGDDADEARIAAENDLDKALAPVMRIKSRYLRGNPMHPNSVAMLKKLSDTKLYFDWAERICAEKNIKINGRMTHIKDGKLFCISSNIGDLYLKKTTSFIIDELTFTLKLMESGIISLPEWIGYDHDMKVCLMQDMGGSDLSTLPMLDIGTSLNMFISLAHLQKNSIQYVKSEGFYGFDYRIGTILDELKDLPESAYKMLSNTQYRITQNETEKLKRNTGYVIMVLESIKNSCLPDTIHHGDLGTYNVRIINGKSIFYDWGCGGVSHPFFDTFRLLSSTRGKLPTDAPAKEIIIDAYFREWSEYGSHEELKNIFTAIDGLAGFYMAYVKYIRARNLHLSFTEKTEAISADGLGLDMRYATAATYLKRFIANDFRII